jgi:poly-gamma-glutamate capsule biosynthesis protein CapA/YwtB (metallophosphatase superfamily)
MKRPAGKRKSVAWLLIIASAMLLFGQTSVGTSSDRSEPRYASFRAEGLSLREAAPSAIKYMRKYFNKRWEAPDTIVHFYRRQTEANKLLRYMAPAGTKHFSVAFTGDIMWIRNGWDTYLDERLRLRLSEYDMVFGNLETPIDTTAKVTSFLPDYAKYNSAPGLIRSFRRDDGTNIFTALSLANNHAFDMGSQGLVNTALFLEGEGIMCTGAFAGPAKITGTIRSDESTGAIDETESAITSVRTGHADYLTIEKGDLRVGFYAAGWGLNDPESIRDGSISMNIIAGIAPLKRDEINLEEQYRVLEKMKADSIDIKILYLHWGYEFELYPDSEIIKAGRDLATAGADMVIGSHPHVIQPVEVCLFNGYKLPAAEEIDQYYFRTTDTEGVPRKALIVYSLGNFTTTMYTSLCRLGLVGTVTVWKDDASGRYDWTTSENLFVYNDSDGLGGSKRRLLIYEDYIAGLNEKSPRRAERLIRQLEPVFNLLGR